MEENINPPELAERMERAGPSSTLTQHQQDQASQYQQYQQYPQHHHHHHHHHHQQQQQQQQQQQLQQQQQYQQGQQQQALHQMPQPALDMSFDQAGAAVSTMGRGDGGGDSSASRLPSLPTSLPVPTPVFEESLLHDVFAEGGDEGLFEVGVERDAKSQPEGTNGEE